MVGKKLIDFQILAIFVTDFQIEPWEKKNGCGLENTTFSKSDVPLVHVEY